MLNNDNIIIRGAKVNNLKNIDVEIPRNKLVVITGLSGSGKTSLAFDTLYAEGQRRYVESLSSYARQFMGKISKPEVDSIKGIPPAIAIEQRVISRNVRSTVGTTTEIYEYLKLLFARIGKTYSPISQKEVKRENVSDVVEYLQNLSSGVKIYILTPIVIVSGRNLREQLVILQKQGFHKLVYNKKVIDIEDFKSPDGKMNNLYLLIDRFKSDSIKEHFVRLADSIQTAFHEGKGTCIVQTETEEKIQHRKFSNRFEMDGIDFEEPTPNLFAFNNPYGACTTCEGAGFVEGIAPELVIPDPSLSVFDGAVACWRGDVMGEWKTNFILKAGKQGFPVHRAIEDLSEDENRLLWDGLHEKNIHGIYDFFEFVVSNNYKIQYRVMQARYRGRTVCPDCKGTHLRADANYVKVNGKSISDLVLDSIENLHQFFTDFKYKNATEKIIAQQLITELTKRTGFLVDVGLGYLTLNRGSRTLSGGESQRINLATALGSSLVGSLYILDEPSIGLHPRDTENLIKVLHRLRDIGNTVVVVEHDEDIIRSADYIIDIGPKAGRFGGEVVFKGIYSELIKKRGNLTSDYIRGMQEPAAKDVKTIPLPDKRRKWKESIEIVGAKEHNLKNITVEIPLGIFVAVTGVSGSGKTTLIRNIFYPALQKMLDGTSEIPGRHTRINANLDNIGEVIMVNQNPLGRSSRSNPITYIKAYDDIRELYAIQPLAKQRNYKASFFSMNTTGGRCEECQGEGVVHISMQFMADLLLPCPECHGKRFKDEVLDIKVHEKTVNDLLNMTINEAIEFLQEIKDNRLAQNAIKKLAHLQEVGLGYLKMGQPSSTLSNGEAQRVKLAFYLSQGTGKQKNLFIFDEPTTGLHFHDINKLYHVFNKLIEQGNSVVVIEHNMELIKCADWIIDLGCEGGEKGGEVVFSGIPEKIGSCKKSHTGRFLRGKV